MSSLKMTGNLSQNIKFFEQQMEIYMTATKNDRKLKVARLLNLISTEVLKLYNSLLSNKMMCI